MSVVIGNQPGDQVWSSLQGTANKELHFFFSKFCFEMVSYDCLAQKLLQGVPVLYRILYQQISLDNKKLSGVNLSLLENSFGHIFEDCFSMWCYRVTVYIVRLCMAV